MSDPLYDGIPIFGTASHVQVLPVPRATQLDAYCAVNGIVLLDGGSRGNMIHIQSLLYDVDYPSLIFDLNLLETYFDNIARPFTDTLGITWYNVCFNAQGFQLAPMGPRPTYNGWCWAFSLVGRSLS